jgi:Protein of unknown function (DUF2971)
MQHIFKYTKLDYLPRILEKCELFFPSPVSFNDPFDCQIRPQFDGDLATLRRHYENILKAKGVVGRAERRRQTKNVQISRSLFEKAFQLTADEIRKTRGVLCFSAINDDILMWSHYADKHSGVCLRFDPANKFFQDLKPVSYTDKYPRMNFLRLVEEREAPGAIGERAREELTTKLFLTKASHWKYEREWRIGMFPLNDPTVGFHPFSAEALTGIIFGVHTPEPEIERIKKRLRLSRCKPELLRAEVSRTDFALEIRQLS